MADITLKRHDTWPPVKATLKQTNEGTGNQEPIDLTGAVKVTFIMKTGSTLVEGTCSIVNAKEGKVEYVFAAGDTAIAGSYEVEFEIEWSPTKIQTVPNGGYNSIVILADLPNA